MTETGWQAIGRIARLRRERLGLKQEELALYGGPGVSTVGKFERGAQPRGFPLRTQHQMAEALGWSRTAIEQVVRTIDEKTLAAEDWEHDLIEENLPDMGRPTVEPERPEDEFESQVLALRALLWTVPDDFREEAFQSATLALLRTPKSSNGEPSDFNDKPLPVSEPPDRTDLSIAADERETPIERGQGHDEHP